MMLHAITPASDRADALAASIRDRADEARAEMGEGMAGYALVIWDARGDCRSAYNCETGPIGSNLMPAYAKDALNRHVAVALAQTRAAEGTSA